MSSEQRDIIIERLERRLMDKENELAAFSRTVSDLESRIINLEREVSELHEIFDEYIKETPKPIDESKTLIAEEYSKAHIPVVHKGGVIIAEDDYSDPFSNEFGGSGELIVAKDNERVFNCGERICKENEDIIITAR